MHPSSGVAPRAAATGEREGPGWAVVAALAVLAILFHVAMEWLFFVTKPSFLSALGWREKLLLPWRVAFPLLAAGLAVIAILFLLALLARPGRGGRRARLLRGLGLALPALILAATFLLLIDNFARTVLGSSLGDLGRGARPAYLALFALLLAGSLRLLAGW